jgi:NAD-dependent deacetylase
MTKSGNKIVFLTGAGISAESGIKTFRDSEGLWEQFRVEEVATPEAYTRNPQLIWRFYSMRRIQAANAIPNKAHEAIVRFSEGREHDVYLITQNVDNLHQKADKKQIIPPICMHGSLNQSRCLRCGTVYLDDHAYFDLEGNYAPAETLLCDDGQRASEDYLHQYKITYKEFLPLSPCCKAPLRPNIVWFGEMPLFMRKIDRILKTAEVFVSIGTSGQVYPAAGFLHMAKVHGARTICINKEVVPQMPYIDEFIEGNATLKVPEFLSRLD